MSAAMDQLIARAEQAGADEQRSIILAAWDVIEPTLATLDCTNLIARHQWMLAGVDLRGMLNASACLDAAMMLVPDGWRISICNIVSPGFHASVHQPGASGEGYGRASTAALALVVACLKARQQEGSDEHRSVSGD